MFSTYYYTNVQYDRTQWVKFSNNYLRLPQNLYKYNKKSKSKNLVEIQRKHNLILGNFD